MSVARRRRRIAAVTVFTSLLVGLAGGASAARIAPRGTILPGVSVGGVELGSLSPADAARRVAGVYETPLDAPFIVRAGAHTEIVTPRSLGTTTDALDALGAALALDRGVALLPRVWHRITGRPLGHALPVRRQVSAASVARYVDGLAGRIGSAPVNSRLEVVDGRIRITPSREGFGVRRKAATEAIVRALLNGGGEVEVPGEVRHPKVRGQDWGPVVLVRSQDNTLTLYDGETPVKTYVVATGTDEYPTPRGRFRIESKRRNPEWINPAKRPGEWGWRLPAKIGPGPDNPLGTRAMNLNVTGIRIHGTNDLSSIGSNATHGCIRMRPADVEDLFERVRVGTPVIVI